MKKLFLASFILLLFTSCSLLQQSAPALSQEEHDAWTLHKKAMQLLARNQNAVAETMFLEAYNKFTLLDIDKGKLQALSGLSKVYASNKDSEKKMNTLQKMKLFSRGNSVNELLYFLTIAENLQIENKPDSLLLLLENVKSTEVNEYSVLLAVYKLNASIALQKKLNTEGLDKQLQEIAAKPVEELENPLLPGFGYYTLALANVYERNFLLAEKNVENALKFDRILNNSRGIADDYVLIGDIFRQTQRENQAYPSYIRAAEIYNLLNLEADRQLTAIKILQTDPQLQVSDRTLGLKKLYTESNYPAVKQKILDILGHIE